MHWAIVRSCLTMLSLRVKNFRYSGCEYNVCALGVLRFPLDCTHFSKPRIRVYMDSGALQSLRLVSTVINKANSPNQHAKS